MSGVSEVVSGKITAIMNFGAFVSLEDGTSGLVHISEISKNFVKDVNDFLSVGQSVKVVSLATDYDGKKRLSMKQADEILMANGSTDLNEFKQATAAPSGEKKFERNKKRFEKKQEAKVSKQNLYDVPPPEYDDLQSNKSENFEDRLSKYMKLSEERLIDAKRQTDNKRGGGYVRRG